MNERSLPLLYKHKSNVFVEGQNLFLMEFLLWLNKIINNSTFLIVIVIFLYLYIIIFSFF